MKKTFLFLFILGLALILRAPGINAQTALTLSVNDNSINSSNEGNIYCNTNISAVCSIKYGKNSDLSDGISVSGQLVQTGLPSNDGKFYYWAQLKNLASSTDYYYLVSCVATSSQEVISDIKLLPKYVPPPALTVTPGTASITAENKGNIYWTTNINATCSIDYSKNSDLSGSTNAIGGLVQIGLPTNDGKFHFYVQLSNLTPSTDYYYHIICSTGDNQSVTSETKLLPKMPVVVNSNVQAIYNFNELQASASSFSDQSGNNLSGRIYGASVVGGVSGSALYFSGVNNYAAVTSNDKLNFGTGDFTISVWVKTIFNTSGNAEGRGDIIAKGDPYNSGYALSSMNNRASALVGSSGRSGYGGYCGTVPANPLDYNNFVCPYDKFINDGVWHNLVTVRSSGLVKIYLDTQLVHQYQSGGNVSTNDALIIGRHGEKSESFFRGKIDEIKIYNNAVSQTQLTADYQSVRNNYDSGAENRSDASFGFDYAGQFNPANDGNFVYTVKTGDTLASIGALCGSPDWWKSMINPIYFTDSNHNTTLPVGTQIKLSTYKCNFGSTVVGGDRDAHGCIGSAGYSWCEAKQKCLRSWEESCVAGNGAPVGGDRDAHGCIGSAGYSWCVAKQKCLRSWEESCIAATSTPVGGDRDAHGCIGSAGYSWCEAKQKCLRSWEESCTANNSGNKTEPTFSTGHDVKGLIGSIFGANYLSHIVTNPSSVKSGLILFRVIRDCATGSPTDKYYQQLTNFGPGRWVQGYLEKVYLDQANYYNYTCGSRFQEQCINDGSFDSYYDEVCATADVSDSSVSAPQQTVAPSPAATVIAINDNASQLYNGNTDSLLAQINQLRNTIAEQASQIRYLASLIKNVPQVPQDTLDAINNFITYGVDPNTVKLGAGQRAAVVNSFKSAFDRLPTTETDITDVVKIANGRWPSQVSTSSEADAKVDFKKVYLREADMKNANDNAAITIMAYGLQQQAVNRNLNSEKSGIKTFKYVYGRLPNSAQDWNIVMAITYSGATR